VRLFIEISCTLIRVLCQHFFMMWQLINEKRGERELIYVTNISVLHVVHIKPYYEILHCKGSYKYNFIFVVLMWLSWKHKK
jgi:hypothetical protein